MHNALLGVGVAATSFSSLALARRSGTLENSTPPARIPFFAAFALGT